MRSSPEKQKLDTKKSAESQSSHLADARATLTESVCVSDSELFTEFVQFEKLDDDQNKKNEVTDSERNWSTYAPHSNDVGSRATPNVQSLLQECIASYLLLFEQIVASRIIKDDQLLSSFVEFMFSRKSLVGCRMEEFVVEGSGAMADGKLNCLEISTDTREVFSLSCHLLVELSSLPMYCSTNCNPGLQAIPGEYSLSLSIN